MAEEAEKHRGIIDCEHMRYASTQHAAEQSHRNRLNDIEEQRQIEKVKAESKKEVDLQAIDRSILDHIQQSMVRHFRWVRGY